jgi:hypothetical protein
MKSGGKRERWFRPAKREKIPDIAHSDYTGNADRDAATEAAGRVEVALLHANRAEAIAAIDRYFATVKAAGMVNEDSMVAELNIGLRAINSLEAMGTMTVRQLCNWTVEEIESLPNTGPQTLEVIRSELARHGLRLKGE